MPVEFEKMKVLRHSALTKKASEKALAFDMGFPYRLYGRLSGLLPLSAHLRQVCTHQRLSKRRWHRIATPGQLLILRVFQVPVDDVRVREPLAHYSSWGSSIRMQISTMWCTTPSMITRPVLSGPQYSRWGSVGHIALQDFYGRCGSSLQRDMAAVNDRHKLISLLNTSTVPIINI